ncbi:MAG TPA: hypothetical protein VHA75_07295, partial [Rugosimonospora sp.]|nr:hypothetical protein [Rugosimonospora sp.]
WALLLGPTGRWLRARLPVLSRPRVAGAALVALALLGMAGYAGLGPRAYAPGYAYAHGVTSERPAAGKYAYRLYAAHPRADGSVTLLADDDPWVTYYATVYLGIFQHAYPAQYALAYPLRPWVPPGGALDAVEATIAASRVPVRVYAVDPATRRTLAAFATTLPAGHLTVLDAATLPR